MKVLIHALGADVGGGLRHISSLVRQLSNLRTENDYTILARDGVLEDVSSANVTVVHVSRMKSSTGLKRFIFDQFLLPRLIKKNSFDVCVSILNFGPLICSAKHIVFQRNALYFDARYQATLPFFNRIPLLARRLLAKLAMLNADIVVSPSISMNEMVKSSCWSDPRFEVLYHAFDQEVLEGRDINPREIGIQDRLEIFYPSHFALHKGFDVLIDTANILVSRGVNFRIGITVDSGYWPEGLSWFQEQIDSLCSNGYLINLGQVSQDEIWDFYQCADVVFFPSKCESFGFPLLESMAIGIPIVASDINTHVEICGKSAIYFNASSPEDAASKLVQMLDICVRNEYSCRSASRYRERDWSWVEYASRFDDLVLSLGDE